MKKSHEIGEWYLEYYRDLIWVLHDELVSKIFENHNLGIKPPPRPNLSVSFKIPEGWSDKHRTNCNTDIF